MSLVGPTAIFGTVNGLLTAVQAIDWPDYLADGGETINTAGVAVVFGEMPGQPERETVAVTGSVQTDAERWDGMGVPSKRAEFSTDVIVITNVPNRTATEAWARLRALVEALHGKIRNLTTGQPTIPAALVALGVYSWGVTSTNTALIPVADVGFVASAVVTIGVKVDF
jgi:hypothetical protein